MNLKFSSISVDCVVEDMEETYAPRVVVFNSLMEHPAVTRFREYLRIPSVQPTPDYQQCVTFLRKVAKELLDVPVEVVECAPGKPVVIITVEGKDPHAPSIMLNSHLDVVPVFEEHWTHPPFEAHKLPNGDIIARGSQDMKCVGMGYLEALHNLKKANPDGLFLRTIHIVFVPDEEIGAEEGMMEFIRHPRFQEMNVGFVMDEGLANPDDAYKVYYGERAPWWFKVTAKGGVGHGSQFIPNTAASKIQKIINRLLEFRASEELRLKTGVKGNDRVPLTLGDVTSVNFTMMKGGVQYNVVPENMEVGFDMRVSPSVHLPRFREVLEGWVKEAGCELEFVQYCGSNAITPLTDRNVWWKAIESGSASLNTKLVPEIFPAATDSRFLRELGIPAIGISPIRHTKVLLHDHNEYLNEQVYLDGIRWYEQVLQRVANVSVEAEQKAGKLVA